LREARAQTPIEDTDFMPVSLADLQAWTPPAAARREVATTTEPPEAVTEPFDASVWIA
jgi:hypothetical protein